MHKTIIFTSEEHIQYAAKLYFLYETDSNLCNMFLGPEFGGAIGLMFTLANSIAVSMYLIGFVEALLDMLEQYIDGFTSILHAGNQQNFLVCNGYVFLGVKVPHT